MSIDNNVLQQTLDQWINQALGEGANQYKQVLRDRGYTDEEHHTLNRLFM